MDIELDQPAPIRRGEELDASRVEAYLRDHLGQSTEPPLIEQFPNGHSNLTYLLRWGQKELILRRPPFGNQVQTAHDMGREFRVLSKLWTAFPAAPRPFLFCDDTNVLGAPFYVMERCRGLILRKKLPSGLQLNSNTTRQLSQSLVKTLAQLHAVDYQSAGLAELGKPVGYVARQVAGWTNRYKNAVTDDAPRMEQVAQWLADNMPADSGAAVIHNDFKFDNFVLDPADITRIIAVLDWEMATLGDPLMDLGTTLGYWVEANDPEPLQRVAVGPTMLPGCMSRRELVDSYERASDRSVPTPQFYYCFGLFKIAVIIQQIYARFVRGKTHDPRFAHMNEVVTVMSRQAQQLIETGRI
jgi:aminoglycoside phosphotransferase (APT) family kinase protein